MTTDNLLQNGSFELDWTDIPIPGTGTINQEPDGWEVEWLEPGDPLLSSVDYGGPDDEPHYLTAKTIPECVHKLNDQLPPDEQSGGVDAIVLDGDTAYKVFSSVNPFGAYMAQLVTGLDPGRRIVLEVPVRVHHHGDGSPGAAVWRCCLNNQTGPWLTFKEDFDDRAYMTFGMDSVVDADGCAFVAIDLESRALAGIDFFVDDVRLRYLDNDPEEPGSPPPSECRGAPREQYVRVVNVVPAWVEPDRYLDIAEIVWERSRETVTGSYDDAGIGDLDDKTAVLWDIPADEHGEYLAFFDDHYPGVWVIFDGDFSTTPPEPDPDPEPPDPAPLPPDPTWKPHNYVPRGTKLGFHAAGDGGQTGDVFAPLTPIGAQPPTAKVIVSLGAARDIKAIDPSVVTIGRMIDMPGFGNVEGFDYGGDVKAQVGWHMTAIVDAFGPHCPYYDYIEILNEQKPPTPEAHVKLAEFFKHCMAIIESWGWSSRLALFSHSVGTPEPADWDAIADTGVFEMAAAGGHCISLHEYNLNTTGGCLYRYRDLYERIILPKHLDIPLYITEYNVDVADAGNADLMFANWTAYDAELARDPYVAGVHIYSTGEVNSRYRPTIYSLWDRYRAYAIAVKERVNG